MRHALNVSIHLLSAPVAFGSQARETSEKRQIMAVMGHIIAGITTDAAEPNFLEKSRERLGFHW
jgi:hypothetical protein